ncbi:hypothetical protein C2L65_15595 [Paraburkholderia terrae]|uniref:Uncharacterized protein n=1 Tax=Paraburkholderia terrae TaxID=311230 RepID=A0A2I8EN19_9BURK|nr:hypothetical protein C2L65_15595 [Paraburkholderia terrae]
MYMLGSQGGLSDETASQVKARLYKEAQQFCAGKGMQVAPINSTGQDARTYDAASAEIQFRCVEP